MIKMPIARRNTGAVITATLTIAGLTACGATDGSASADSEAADTQETIQFTFGDYSTELPANPQRVVALDRRTGLEFTLLAEWPIAAADVSGAGDHLLDMLPDDVTELQAAGVEPDPEEIASHSPDLIVVSESWWNYYQENNLPIDDIAPVYIVEEPAIGESRTWKETFATQMDSVNKGEEAEELLENYESTIEEVRDEIPASAQGATVGFGAGGSSDGELLLNADPLAAAVAEDLGFEVLSDDFETLEGFNWAYSMENLDIFVEADYLFMTNLEAIEGDAWDRVPAVESNRVSDLSTHWNAGLALTTEELAHYLGDEVTKAYE